jgi:hypothetical protein
VTEARCNLNLEKKLVDAEQARRCQAEASWTASLVRAKDAETRRKAVTAKWRGARGKLEVQGRELSEAKRRVRSALSRVHHLERARLPTDFLPTEYERVAGAVRPGRHARDTDDEVYHLYHIRIDRA